MKRPPVFVLDKGFFFHLFFSTESFIICIKHVLFTMFCNEQALIHPGIILNIVKWTFKKGLYFNNKYLFLMKVNE